MVMYIKLSFDLVPGWYVYRISHASAGQSYPQTNAPPHEKALQLYRAPLPAAFLLPLDPPFRDSKHSHFRGTPDYKALLAAPRVYDKNPGVYNDLHKMTRLFFPFL